MPQGVPSGTEIIGFDLSHSVHGHGAALGLDRSLRREFAVAAVEDADLVIPGDADRHLLLTMELSAVV